MAVKFSNNYSTFLSGDINSTTTTVVVQSVSGLPTLGVGDYTYLTIDSDTVTPTLEVVKVTAVDVGTGSLTVVRGQDGTTASSFLSGAKVELRVNAALLNDLSDEASITDWTDVLNKPDPTLTITGDITGSATFTDLASASLTATASADLLRVDGDGSDLQNVRAETIEVNVKNVSGGSLAKGTPVHQTGTSGAATFEVVAADASNASVMPAHFVLLETLANGAEGRGLLMGRISGVNTAGFAEGDTIYVAVGGGYTNVAPTGEGNLIQNLGTVTRVDATNGGGEVMGAGRSAATPNLNQGNIFLGNASNQAATASLSTSVSNLSHYNNSDWDTAFSWGDHSVEGYLTGNQTITLSGDVSGSGTTSIVVTVADDSHNHVISNVDGLQTALNAKQDASTALTTSTTFGGDVSGTYNAIVIADDSHNHVISNVDGLQAALDTKYESGDSISVANITATGYLRGPSTFTIDPAAHGDDTGTVVIAGNLQIDGTTTTVNSTTVTIDDLNLTLASGAATASAANGAGITIDGASATIIYNSAGDEWQLNKPLTISGNTAFHDGYHPNADKWTTARTLSLTGAVTGSVSIDGSGNVSLATTATSDPTLTLAGDASGTATFTNLGNATLTVTVADDSHNHIIGNVDGLQAALDAKQAASTALTTSTTFGGDVSGTYNAIVVADDSHNHVISNVDGLQTALDGKINDTGDVITGALEQSYSGTVWSHSEGTVRPVSRLTYSEAGNIGTTGTSITDVYGEADLSAIDNGATFTYAAAWDAVESHGGRLPTLAELMDGVGQGSGQSYDAEYLWTCTPAGPHHVWVALGDYSTTSDRKIVDITNASEVYRTRAFFDVSRDGKTVNYEHDGILRIEGNNRAFHDGYHPNADKWTTARTLSLTGAVTGSASIDGSGNVSLATTNTADPTLTLAGDASGSATFTNLGNATLTVTVADDSHNHVISNVDGLQTALDAKQAASTALTTSTTFGGDVSGTYNAIVVADDSHNHIIGNVDGLQTALDGKLGSTANAVSASKWATARTVSLTGAVTGSASVDGSANVSIATTHTADPTITLTGAVTGSGTMTNLGNVSIATTATADPTLTLSGDVTGSATFTNLGNATLTATVANDSHTHSISTISDEHRLFNNMGDNHSTRSDFNATYDFGWRYIQGTTNGPGVNSATQYYSVYAGLGNEYLYNTYGMQLAWGRNVTLPYPTVRYRENGTWGGWQKISAGQADKWTTARTLSLTGAVTGSASIDGSGNVSLATTATSDPTLTLSGDASGSATFTNLGNATLSVTVANDSHTHDGRYYTESESNARYVQITGGAYNPSGGSISTASHEGSINYVYNSAGGTPTRGDCSVHVYHVWSTNLSLNLTSSTWQTGDIVRVSNAKGTQTITVSATRIYLPDGSYDTSVTFNNAVGGFVLAKYTSTTGYWMVMA